MDSLRIGDVVAVSRHWTPSHIDVTSAPLNYAKPKADWLGRLEYRRPLAPVDEADRMRRRALNRHTIVDPTEIRKLPEIEVASEPADEPGAPERPWRHLLQRLSYIPYR